MLACLAALALAGCGGGDGDNDPPASFDDTAAESAPTTQGTAAQPAPEGCEGAEQPEPKQDGGAEKPPDSLDGAARVTIETNCGEFTVGVDPKAAPKAAASFVSLARQGFYDGTIFHRIVPGFVIQGGDPTGSGTGGPGYKTVDPPGPDATYGKGVVAMAKGGMDPPGTAESQFFVVTGDEASLPPEYAVVGKVTEGIDVAEKIGELGDPATEQPTSVVVLEKARVKE